MTNQPTISRLRYSMKMEATHPNLNLPPDNLSPAWPHSLDIQPYSLTNSAADINRNNTSPVNSEPRSADEQSDSSLYIAHLAAADGDALSLELGESPSTPPHPVPSSTIRYPRPSRRGGLKNTADAKYVRPVDSVRLASPFDAPSLNSPSDSLLIENPHTPQVSSQYRPLTPPFAHHYAPSSQSFQSHASPAVDIVYDSACSINPPATELLTPPAVRMADVLAAYMDTWSQFSRGTPIPDAMHTYYLPGVKGRPEDIELPKPTPRPDPTSDLYNHDPLPFDREAYTLPEPVRLTT